MAFTVIVGGDLIDITQAPFMLAIESFYLSCKFIKGKMFVCRDTLVNLLKF